MSDIKYKYPNLHLQDTVVYKSGDELKYQQFNIIESTSFGINIRLFFNLLPNDNVTYIVWLYLLWFPDCTNSKFDLMCYMCGGLALHMFSDFRQCLWPSVLYMHAIQVWEEELKITVLSKRNILQIYHKKWIKKKCLS